MKAPAIPDYVSPIVGHRVWKWKGNEIRALNGEVWLPGRALTAKCRKTDHESPAYDCSCGIYACKNYQQLQKIFDFNVGYGLHGEVYLWGKVVEHDLGYRAQFAYPKSFVLPLNIDPRLEPSVLEPLTVYGADISLLTNILVWKKGSGYTPAGLDWLVETGKPCGKWCKQWHERTLQVGDCVTVFGRGIGLVEPDDGSSGCTVCIRLKNNDVFIVPYHGIAWNCQKWRWEVDRDTPAIERPRAQKSSDEPPILPNPVSPRTSTPPKSREELPTQQPVSHRSASPGNCASTMTSSRKYDDLDFIRARFGGSTTCERRSRYLQFVRGLLRQLGGHPHL